MAFTSDLNGNAESIRSESPHLMTRISGKSTTNIDIINIRHDAVEINLKGELLSLLMPERGPKRMPTLLLYDELGLQLFEKVTYLPEYYLTNAEIDVLERSADSIARAVPPNSMVVELGSGNLRKVSILLQALDAAGKDIDYYALDLSLKELSRTLQQVPKFSHVKCHGLHGTYDDGLEWLKLPENKSRPKFVMSMGSSNFDRHDAAQFLRAFSEVLQPSDYMLIGLDGVHDPARVYHAYNDQKGVTHQFILNGLLHANAILGEQAFKLEDWSVIGEYVYDVEGGRHQAFYSPIHDISYNGIHFAAGERVQVERSLKYSPEAALELWEASGLREADRWSASSQQYNLHLLSKPKMVFDTDPSVYAATTVPTLKDWDGLWSVWDLVTRGMIPDEELMNKPIKLRNACIFYLGHIPTFLDIQLTKVTDLPPCEPTYYPTIFERGIDPDVDNPEHCHDHSPIPEEWPPLEEILRYQDQVRAKVQELYQSKEFSRKLGRALWVGFEHEAHHLETLLYMLLQSDKTLPPTAIIPDFKHEAKVAEAIRVPNEWFQIPEQEITVGLNDPDDNSGPDNHFGWDNEKPPQTIVVPSFYAQGRPVTNEDYAHYLEQTHNSKLPASWSQEAMTNGHTNGHTNGSNSLSEAYLNGKSVRTVYGLVPLKYALDWPVFASYDELTGCAEWMGGRIPTVEEARSIYSHVDGLKLKEAEQHLGKTIPAVNGHLVNDGVEESPPARPLNNGEGSHKLFTSLEGANVGFKNWHPVAVTGNGNKLAGHADMGGVWEWTSSQFARYEGFEPMNLYPAYSADFFDGKHNIILGGSWATHPRVAGRKTFVNWYQRNYPYTWAGARLVRDLPFCIVYYSLYLEPSSPLPRMNWATITPENRLYKGKDLFRSGFDIRIPDARAKTSCIGKHVEPCYRFHQQLHFLGKSHECFGSDELHHSRHKDILKIIREINAIDEAKAPALLTVKRHNGESGSESRFDGSCGNATDTGSEYVEERLSSKMTKRQRKVAKKTGIGIASKRPRTEVELFRQEDLNFVSEALHLRVHESKGAWAGTYGYGNRSHDLEDHENATILENDEENETPETPDSGMKVIKFLTPKELRSARKTRTLTPARQSKLTIHSKRNTTNRAAKANLVDTIDPQIFFRLGVEVVHPVANSKARKDLVEKLVVAIKNDLDIIAREEEETVIREEGFWRWAGRNAYHAIKRVREDYDWATGQRKDSLRQEITPVIEDEVYDRETNLPIPELEIKPSWVSKKNKKDKATPKAVGVNKLPSPKKIQVPILSKFIERFDDDDEAPELEDDEESEYEEEETECEREEPEEEVPIEQCTRVIFGPLDRLSLDTNWPEGKSWRWETTWILKGYDIMRYDTTLYNTMFEVMSAAKL
ncbi:hypothetical protein B7494_g4128 [Chlorociboria aeruginascens]|nr:hypothetical protein B7494_g4128 [Chlorociboria aeruginascens]